MFRFFIVILYDLIMPCTVVGFMFVTSTIDLVSGLLYSIRSNCLSLN